MLAELSRPPEHISEFEDRIRKLYYELRIRHAWMYNLFGSVARNEADIDEMVHETLCRYLRIIRATLYDTKGVYHSYRADELIDMENGEPVAVRLGVPYKVIPIPDLERYILDSPDGWFSEIARSVLRKYIRNAA